jgi:acyl transferase domain-containing protein
MFSGQGSQYYGMGRDLFESERKFRQELERCSDLARPRLGMSLIDVIFGKAAGTYEPMTRLRESHPALFAFQFALAQTLFARGLRPDAVLGYSLGEIVALAVAGVLTLDEALRVVITQAEELERIGPRGAMLAIVDAPSLVTREPALFEETWIAADNFAKHFVVSGTTPAIARIEGRLGAGGVNVALLPVEYPFHSPLLEPVAAAFQVTGLTLQPASVEVVSACRARPLDAIDDGFFWEVARNRVRFRESVAFLEARGSWRYVDAGPSGTLGTFTKYNLGAASRSEIFPIVTPWGGAGKNLARLS